MSKGFNKLLFLGLAALVSAYILLYTPLNDMLWGPKPKAPAASTLKAAPVAKKAPSKTPKVEKEKKEEPKIEKIPKFSILRDPFEVKFAYEKVEQKEEKEVVKKEGLYLQGIFIEGKNKYAIIDDKLVHEGDRTFLNYKVYRILSDRVIVLKGKQRKVLKIELGVE